MEEKKEGVQRQELHVGSHLELTGGGQKKNVAGEHS